MLRLPKVVVFAGFHPKGNYKIARKQIINAVSAGFCIVLLTLLAVAAIRRETLQTAARLETAPTAPRILLDPGHGGEDGGAVGVDGTVEKDINLSLTRKLEIFLRVMGYRVSMTRTTDTAVYDKTAQTLREKKSSDIHNRFAMMESLGANALFLSIHQNNFSQESSKGTQVFYSANHPQSEIYAKAVQSEVVRLLQPNNTRQVKASGTSIFLLYRAKIPAILVECGFLSNWEDVKKLKQEGYQNEMAFAIACGLLNCD
jgi:N-acetylmuramoyl-L-alanine amidase